MLYSFFDNIQEFLNKGGWVLYLIFFTIFVLWYFIIERIWYFKFHFKKDSQPYLEKWLQFSDPLSPSSRSMWESDMSILKQRLNKNLSHVKTIVSLCPLMGLLGTVTGMITVFEIMAVVGTGNARLMASGISMATIPTMAGMIGALSGIYIHRLLENHVTKEKQKLMDCIVQTMGSTR